MASPISRKQCANKDGCKQVAITNCEGCLSAFCLKHFNDHRRLLDEEMNIIISEHNELKNTLNENTMKPELHSLINEVNNWEKESITKIQQRANELRQQIQQDIISNLNEASKELQKLSEKLRASSENDNFVETDIENWKKTLSDLKTNIITSPYSISIDKQNSCSLVQNISFSLAKDKERFEQVFDNEVKIEENGQVIVHDDSCEHSEIRGKNEYTTGLHKIRLHIQETQNIWMFLGINSKLTPLQRLSYNSKSTYGWSSNNDTWTNGEKKRNNSTDVIEMKENDVISLIFDCDAKKIMMINERTNTKHELPVDIENCPYPWQLHVNLYDPNACLSILQS